MRILFISGALYGHVNTMLPLALAARDAGHTVAFATGPDFANHLERRGLHAWPVGLSHDHAGGSRQDSWLAYFAATAERRATDLIPLAVEWQPDLVVHEETELSGPVVAARCNARHAVHGLGLMPPRRIWPAFVDAIERLGASHAVPDVVAGLARAQYLHLCPPALQSAEAAVWQQVLPLRPIAGLPDAREHLPARFALLPHERTVHLTLGTVFSHRAEVLEQAIAGLRTLPLNLVVAVGPDEDPARYGAQPAHVLLERYLPHAMLLPHCALVVSHGGAGTMFGALSHGLPQLIIPQGADQFLNAEAAAASGVALTMAGSEVSAEAVARAARCLLDEPAYTQAAGRVRREILAMPDATRVLATLTAPEAARAQG
jgi:UDP:flavonoid glycosyltransferase YjiC (YdhE family)